MSFGCLLDVFWMSSGCQMDVLWMSFGCVLDVFWMSVGCLLNPKNIQRTWIVWMSFWIWTIRLNHTCINTYINSTYSYSTYLFMSFFLLPSINPPFLLLSLLSPRCLPHCGEGPFSERRGAPGSASGLLRGWSRRPSPFRERPFATMG